MNQPERWYGCYAGGRGDLFTRESNRHPAKMAVALCYRIFEHGRQMGYWQPGDAILDPMAGIGTTLVVGYSLGYNVIGVELEEHFVKLLALNMVRCVEKIGAQGWFRIVQGDARRLREVLSCQPPVVSVVTSPPYTKEPRQGGDDKHPERMEGAEWSGKYSGAISGPPYSDAISTAAQRGKPSSGWVNDKGIAHNLYGKGTAQIGNLRDPKGDIDAVLSSPPYEGSMKSEEDTETRAKRTGGFKQGMKNLRYGESRVKFLGRDPSGLSNRDRAGLSAAQNNIGQCVGQTYLSAMLAVYRELHAVLKPAGVVCLVTKNPVKAGTIRRLDEDTIRLMNAAGFTLIERKVAMLTEELGEQMTLDGGSRKIRRSRMSFFKRLHVRKHPELAILWEDVLFFRRREEQCHAPQKQSQEGGKEIETAIT